MHRFPWLIAALIVLLSGLLGACRRSGTSDVARTDEGVLQPGTVEAVDTLARAVAPSNRPLVLEGMRGSVHLTGADRTTADLSFVRRGRGTDAGAARSVLGDISITEEGTEREYVYTLTAGRREGYAAVDVRGQVPRPAALRIDRISGPVHLAGVEGRLTVEHEHGSVNVRGAAAPVAVDIENGDVHVGFRAVPEEGPIRLRTANGDVRVGLPPEGSAQIDAQTRVGTIRTHGVSLDAERYEPLEAGARYDAQMGENGPTIELRTENGSITVQAADTAQVDTAEASSAPETPPVAPPDTTVSPPAVPDTGQTDTMRTDTTAKEQP